MQHSALPAISGWTPEHARPEHGRPEVGWLIGWRHRVWRVIAVDDFPEDRWSDEHRDIVRTFGRRYTPVHVWLRPADKTDLDPVRLRSQDVSVSGVPRRTVWWVYPDEHYPLCATCGEPPPCREVYASAVARREMTRLRRYETAGVCPACGEPVSQRQRSITFEGNLHIPTGPPVTFHRRDRCVWTARAYERQWVAADPDARRGTLSCPGLLTNHNDGTYDCSASADCRGPDAFHDGGYCTCRCPDCHAKGRFDCHPAPRARRNCR